MTEPSTPTQTTELCDKLRANTAQIRKGITEAGFTITPDIHPITTI
ncbi:MAG: hypothetical protein IKI28_03560 [Bacteroidales bacterium]|nr:hypothetical protein [Bacteroidales bacterium]